MHPSMHPSMHLPILLASPSPAGQHLLPRTLKPKADSRSINANGWALPGATDYVSPLIYMLELAGCRLHLINPQKQIKKANGISDGRMAAAGSLSSYPYTTLQGSSYITARQRLQHFAETEESPSESLPSFASTQRNQ